MYLKIDTTLYNVQNMILIKYDIINDENYYNRKR